MLRKIILRAQSNAFRPFQRFTSTQTSQKYSLQQEHIDEAIKQEPNLAIYTPEIWHRAHNTFLNHGYETMNFLRIVTGNPTILQRPTERIIQSLEIWRCCQFGENLLHLLLTKYPELLDVTNSQRFLTHIAYLKTRVSTKKNIWKVLMNCPDLLSQSEEVLEEKFNYCIDVMRLEVPEIVKSAALSKSLEDIRCRHVFLERLGLFTPRSLKAETHDKNTNHRLYQITDTSDKAFATKICHVSLPEYEAFKELHERELRRKERRSDKPTYAHRNEVYGEGEEEEDDELLLVNTYKKKK